MTPSNVFPFKTPVQIEQEKRGLTDAEISSDQLDLYSMNSEQIKQFMGWRYCNESGVAIPSWGIDGSPLAAKDGEQMVRIRRAEGKDPKYLSRPGSGTCAYLPRLAGMNWRKCASDAAVDLWITEGEFKAIAACKLGRHTVGLQGVDCVYKDRGLGLLVDPLGEFTWDGRRVVICFDCDQESTPDQPHKKDVERALVTLASRLSLESAKVQVAYLARTSKWVRGQKLGLDDYFQLGGTWDELDKTVENAAVDEKLAYFLENYAVYTGEGVHVIRTRDGHRYNDREFTMLESKWKYVTDKKSIKVAQIFLEHPLRPEVDRYVFDPRLPTGFLKERRLYNRWSGYATEPKRNDSLAGVWETFIKGLHGEHWSYVMSWYAHLLQCPGEKTTISLVTKSKVNGIGKSLKDEIIRNIIGERHSLEVDLDRLTDKFNALLEGKVFVQIDEAEGLYKGKESKLKNFITSDKATVEKKRMDAIVVDNYARASFNSNAVAPFRLTPHDRRFFVDCPPLTDDDARGQWGRWVASEVAALKNPEGRAAVLYYLLHWDLSGWDPTKPAPMTDAKADMIQSSARKVDAFAEAVYDRLPDVFVVTPQQTSVDAHSWGEILGLVEPNGGIKVKWQIKNSSTNGAKVTAHVVAKRQWMIRYKTEDKSYTKVVVPNNGAVEIFSKDGQVVGSIKATEAIGRALDAAKVFGDVSAGFQGSSRKYV